MRVPLHEIDYLEVRQNYVTVHAGETYTVKKTLGAMERALDDPVFPRRRSFILNLSRVRRVTKKEVLLANGACIPLPARRVRAAEPRDHPENVRGISPMAFFTKRLDRRIAAYQQELLETHYREVENIVPRKCAAGGTTTATTSSF